MNTTITNTRSKQTRTKDADYLFFTDANAEATAIIFRVEGKELKAIKNSKIYRYLIVEVLTDQWKNKMVQELI